MGVVEVLYRSVMIIRGQKFRCPESMKCSLLVLYKELAKNLQDIDVHKQIFPCFLKLTILYNNRTGDSGSGVKQLVQCRQSQVA
jgi:hypothetical protein